MNREAGRAVALILILQLLFWGCYALAATLIHPPGVPNLRVVDGRLLRIGDGRPMAVLVAGLVRPAELRLPGWQTVLVEPRHAMLLSPVSGARDTGVTLTCIAPGCSADGDIVLGAAARVERVARWESLVRFDLPRVTILCALVLGLALLGLLPVSRFSRLQMVTGMFLLLVAADAYLSGMGQVDLPTDQYELLRYTVQYGPLAFAALMLNALAGWQARSARWILLLWLAAGIGIVALWWIRALTAVLPWLDTAVLLALAGYGVHTLRRLWNVAPQPAARAMALLLVGVASVLFDVAYNATPGYVMLNASNLSPLLIMIGIVAELAIQGHRLNQASDEARSELARQLSEQDAHLLRSSTLLRYQERRIAIDAERQRLVRDMHDGIGATLTHLLLDLRGGRIGPAELETGLRAALDDLRNIAGAIDGSDGPVDLALAAFCERMAPRLERAGIAFDYRCTLPDQAPVLDARRLLSLHRLLQEAVGNALRHAAAGRVTLTLAAAADDALLVTVEDDGRGFDPARAEGAPGEGRGLGNIRRRAEQLGGRLSIDSMPGHGTRIALHVPLRDDRRSVRR